MAANSPDGRYRIGELIVDLTLGELERAGVRERLPDQVAEVLAALVARPNELVTRETLIARLWPRATYSDTDAGLNTVVKKLRAALGDDADRPRYIETVPRRGYRLIATVEQARTAQAPQPQQTPPVKSNWLSPTALLGVLGALAVLAALLVYNPRDRGETTRASAVPIRELPSRTVAVLPFLNLTGDARQDYLALGLAENVIHQLAQLHEITVIARTSSFAVSTQRIDTREIGRKLNARYILEGSVQATQRQLRITTQLIDASTGEHVWSKRFDRVPEDLLAVQSEIALNVAAALQLSIERAPTAQFARSGTQNPEAWTAYELGRSLVMTRKYANILGGIENLERAVQLDPRFAAAFVELSDAYVLRTQYAPAAGSAELHAGRDQAISKAIAAANQALAIDPTLGEALILRGSAEGYIDQYDQSEKDLRAGLALSPSSARGHQILGALLIEHSQKIDEGLALLDRASLLDPLEPRAPYYRGFTELRRGRAVEAERSLLEAIHRRPDYAPALTRLSSLYGTLRGEFSTAVRFGELALKADPDTEFVRSHLTDAYVELDEIDAAGDLNPPGSTIVDLRVGKIDEAASRVRSFPERFVPCDYVVHSYAMLEDAQRTRDFTGARKFLERVAQIDLTGSAPHGRPGSEFSATIVAQLLSLGGDAARAHELLANTLEQAQNYRSLMLPNCGNTNRTLARTLALLGRDAEALKTLSRSMLQENAWYLGWYVFERDPAFAQLHGTPEFASLHAAYRARVAAERAKLVQMREDGIIPARP
ncbi:MAG TPA: winged helix-turn-helix domain-containing protein [Steroidobacteraceae bacterium]